MTFISAIMPARNAAAFLAEAIESVLAQTHGDFELLIVDDASNDDTPVIAKDFTARDSRVHLLTQSIQIGQSKAINLGISQARHELMMMIDADDILLKDCIERQIDFLCRHPGLVAAGCLARLINNRGRVFWSDSNPFLTPDAFAKAYAARDVIYFRHSGFIMSRTAFLQTGGYRDIPQANDIDLFNRLAECGPVLTNPEVLIYYRIHPQQSTLQYKKIIVPRLTWGWIRACNQSRRAGEPEPDLRAYLDGFKHWPLPSLIPFWMKAMAQGLYYEAKCDFILLKPSFLWKCLAAFVLAPGLISRKAAGFLLRYEKSAKR